MHHHSPSSSLLDHLRIGTQEAHLSLEGQIDIEHASHGENSYRQLLEAFWGFYEPLEERLKSIYGWEGFGFSWDERSKVPMLEHDLHALGSARFFDQSLPRCAKLPNPQTIADAFGCAYVLEGATLGGRQIVEVLRKSSVPTEARAFFTNYGEATGTRWRDFCGMLERVDTPSYEPAVAMASRTFETLACWLGQN